MQGDIRPSVSTFHFWMIYHNQNLQFAPVHSAEYTVHTIHSAGFAIHSAELTIHSVQFRIHSAQFRVHSAEFTIESAQCTIHSAHSAHQSLIPNAGLGLVAVCPLLGMEPPPISSPLTRSCSINIITLFQFSLSPIAQFHNICSQSLQFFSCVQNLNAAILTCWDIVALVDWMDCQCRGKGPSLISLE